MTFLLFVLAAILFGVAALIALTERAVQVFLVDLGLVALASALAYQVAT